MVRNHSETPFIVSVPLLTSSTCNKRLKSTEKTTFLVRKQRPFLVGQIHLFPIVVLKITSSPFSSVVEPNNWPPFSLLESRCSIDLWCSYFSMFEFHDVSTIRDCGGKMVQSVGYKAHRISISHHFPSFCPTKAPQTHPLTTQLRVVVWVMVRQAGYAPLRSPVAFSGAENKGWMG